MNEVEEIKVLGGETEEGKALENGEIYEKEAGEERHGDLGWGEESGEVSSV